MLNQVLESSVPRILSFLVDSGKSNALVVMSQNKFKKHPCLHWIDTNAPGMVLVWLDKHPGDMFLKSDRNETLLLYLAESLGCKHLSTVFLSDWTNVALLSIQRGLSLGF